MLISVALDEIPTATCEPSKIATWKGLKLDGGHKDPTNRASTPVDQKGNIQPQRHIWISPVAKEAEEQRLIP